MDKFTAYQVYTPPATGKPPVLRCTVRSLADFAALKAIWPGDLVARPIELEGKPDDYPHLWQTDE